MIFHACKKTQPNKVTISEFDSFMSPAKVSVLFGFCIKYVIPGSLLVLLCANIGDASFGRGLLQKNFFCIKINHLVRENPNSGNSLLKYNCSLATTANRYLKFEFFIVISDKRFSAGIYSGGQLALGQVLFGIVAFSSILLFVYPRILSNPV